MFRRKLFCEYGPVCYYLSVWKENRRKEIMDFISRKTFAKNKRDVPLPYLIKGHFSLLRRNLEGVDPALQNSKVTNLQLACKWINGLLILPGETFSFWHTVGSCTKRKGYQPGLTIWKGALGSSVGGGLCQLANLIHYMVLHSPLQVVELHHHTDAIFPNSQRRVPFGTGTSIFYKKVDYRFYNPTQDIWQIRVWVDDNYLYGELLCSTPCQYRYRLQEENHFFSKEGEDYYRNSQVFRLIFDCKSKTLLEKQLILSNHSKVLYSSHFIPKEELREGFW